MLRRTKFVAKEAILRGKYFMARDCIFCKIVKKEIPSKAVFENDWVIAFPDINPVCDVHILIVPKRHIESVLAVSDTDGRDLAAMYKTAGKIVKDMGLSAFRVVFNGGKFQHVPHLHMHLLAGSKMDLGKL